MFMTSVCEENISAEVQLIHAEHMSSYNFIILRKKRDSTQVFSSGIQEIFKNSGSCFWKHITYYYVIKNYIGRKLAIFNAILFTLLYLLLTRWWDMRLKHDVAWLWEEKADSINMCLKRNELWLMLYYIDKDWYCFI